MRLRDYQNKFCHDVRTCWFAGLKVVVGQLPTGGGKTPILGDLISGHDGHSAVIAHRDKLVEQISLLLASVGVEHDLIASIKTKKIISVKHAKKFGRSFYRPGARCRVVSVQSIKNATGLEAWLAEVTLWIVDEGHHVIAENQWGDAVKRFTHPDCVGLKLTATPGRPDRKGLSRHRSGCNGGPCEGCGDGFADAIVFGPTMRWLIDEGFLCDYDVIAPPSDLIIREKAKGKDGDYTRNQVRDAERASHVVGDIAETYDKYGQRRSGVTFVGSIETATEVVDEYRKRGISAELITGDTDPDARDKAFDRAAAGELNQIVAVDVISEGVDIPALVVGSFARLTQSIIIWLQQLGRILRPFWTPQYAAATTREERLAAIAASPKPRALIIDHINGFRNLKLGPPDRPRTWTMYGKEAEREQDDDIIIPQKVCTNKDRGDGLPCLHPFERTIRKCPKCGHVEEPVSRTLPEHVDGELALLDPEALAALQGRVLNVGKDRRTFEDEQIAKGANPLWLNRHWDAAHKDMMHQVALRESMDRFAGRLHAAGHDNGFIQRSFYLSFGVDVVTAMSLKTKEADALRERIDRAVNSR